MFDSDDYKSKESDSSLLNIAIACALVILVLAIDLSSAKDIIREAERMQGSAAASYQSVKASADAQEAAAPPTRQEILCMGDASFCR